MFTSDARRRAAQALATAGVIVLASTLQLSAAQAEGVPAWTVPVQVTPPGTSATQSVMATTPSGLIEAYLQDDVMVVRRHTSTGWGAPRSLETSEAPFGNDIQAVAASDTRTYVASVYEEGDEQRVWLTTVEGDNYSGGTLGSGTAPSLALLADGSAALAYISAGGTEVHARHALPDGGTGPVTVVATAENGIDYVSTVLDKDGQPMLVWAECADVDCETSNLRSSTSTDLTTWSEPTTILGGVGALGFNAASGQGRVLLHWLDYDPVADEISPRVLEQVDGVWGSLETVSNYGYPLIASDGTEVLASPYGTVSYRAAGATAWTDAPIGPEADEDCDPGNRPALEQGTLVLHQSVPDPLGSQSCRLMESRIDVTAPAAVADATAPAIAITSGPSGLSNQSAVSVGFTTDDATNTVCRLDGSLFMGCASPRSYTGVGNGPHTFVVAAKDAAGNWSYATRSWTTDVTVPVASVTAPTVPLSLGNPIVVTWTGSDAGGSGLSSFDVRIAKAAPGAGFSAWSYPTGLQLTKAKTTSLPGYAGYTSCVQVRAHDGAGNVSAWSAQRCTALPVDDRSLAASAGWSRITGSPFFAKTATSTTRLGATLVSPTLQSTRLALVATKCRTCGVVGVYVGPTLIAKVNLAATVTSYRNVINLPRFSLRTTKVTVKVLTSGKTVQIDGLSTSRV